MSRQDEIQLFHVAEVLRESPPGLGREIEIRSRLSAADRARLSLPAARLAGLLRERDRPEADPLLLELAVADTLGSDLTGKRLAAAWRKLERATAALDFWNGLAPSRRREAAALAPSPLPRPDASSDLAGLLLFLDRLAAALPAVPPRQAAALYRDLAPREGQELATGAAELLAGHTALDRELAERMLLFLACLVPDALHGLHERLARQGVLHPGELFRDAGADTRDLLLAQLPEAGEAVPFLLTALAWIGDAVVRIRFRDWSTAPPPWAAELAVPPELHALDAAWHLQTDASSGHMTRRDLYSEECWSLVPPGAPGEDPAESGAQGPVRVVLPHGEDCPWCGGPLVTLFDFDLTDPRMSFIGIAGSRLRIATCPRCLPYAAPILTEVDGEGGSAWSPANQEPTFRGDDIEGLEELDALPAGGLVLGERQRTPLAARPFAHAGASQLGGIPAWLQEAEFPLCPECLRPMPFLAELQLADLGTTANAADVADGMFYAFLCAADRRAATLFQQG
jgi:hypothetical protein